MGPIARFFGGPPLFVLFQLAVISVFVGLVLSALGLNPLDILGSIESLLIHIYHMGFDAVEWAWRYFLLGAVIVFPLWLIGRVFNVFGSGRRKPPAN